MPVGPDRAHTSPVQLRQLRSPLPRGVRGSAARARRRFRYGRGSACSPQHGVLFPGVAVRRTLVWVAGAPARRYAATLIERALAYAGQVAASSLVAALLIATGFAGLDRQRVSSVSAGSLTQPDGRQATSTPVVTWSSPPPIALANDVARAVRVAPHLDAVEPKTAGVPIHAAIVMSFSQRMNRQSVEASFLILPAAEGRFGWSDEYTLRFEPFRLADATSYQVEVGGRSVVGAQVSGSRWWSFTTVGRPPDALAPGPTSINVPILTYHYIRVNPDRYDRMGFALSVTPSDFAAQTDWLAQNGYHTITTEDLYTYLNGYGGLPSKPVILTFDDGYADFYTTALPILRSHGFVGV